MRIRTKALLLAVSLFTLFGCKSYGVPQNADQFKDMCRNEMYKVAYTANGFNRNFLNNAQAYGVGDAAKVATKDAANLAVYAVNDVTGGAVGKLLNIGKFDFANKSLSGVDCSNIACMLKDGAEKGVYKIKEVSGI